MIIDSPVLSPEDGLRIRKLLVMPYYRTTDPDYIEYEGMYGKHSANRLDRKMGEAREWSGSWDNITELAEDQEG